MKPLSPIETAARLRAVSSDEITPSEAADVGKAVSAHIAAITAADMAARLARLEDAAAGRPLSAASTPASPRSSIAYTRGVHRFTDDALSGLIAWLQDPRPADEAWAVAGFRREGLPP